LYIISIKVKTNDFHEFSALSRLETAVEPKPRLVCDRLGTEPAEYGNSRGCHNRLAVSRVAATLVVGTVIIDRASDGLSMGGKTSNQIIELEDGGNFLFAAIQSDRTLSAELLEHDFCLYRNIVCLCLPLALVVVEQHCSS
jgi:hypothetical protein